MSAARHNTQDQETPQFLIGREEHGFWAARAADGREGGLFVSREEAEKFARQARLRGLATVLSAPVAIDLWK